MSAEAVVINPLELDVEITEVPKVDEQQQVRWQALWVTLVEKPWRTLAVVPVGAATLGRTVVTHLVEAALGMRQSVVQISDVTEHSDAHIRRIMFVPTPLSSPAAALQARSTDAVLLALCLGEDTLEQAERVKEMIGRDRILGCVAAQGRARKR